MKSESKSVTTAPESREKDKGSQTKKKSTKMAVEIRKKDKGKQVEKKLAKKTALEPRKKDKALKTQDADADASADASGSNDQAGVVYLGGIPHGFYEHQLRSFFSQFGEVTRLRISRSKKTGASRHHGFIEFAEPATAEIVAKATDGYLLMGNILRCRVVAPEAVHPDLWKGAGRRFKAVPWSRIAGKRLERAATESVWERRIAKEDKRRRLRAEKLKAMDYEFEGPALKAAEAKEMPALEGGEEEAVKAIEAGFAGSAED